MNYKATRNNLCTSIRNAVIAIGCSPVMALNIINSEAGNMAINRTGEDKTSDFKAKLYKSADKENIAQVTVKPGSIQFKSKLTTALQFAAYNDLNAKCELLNPRHTVAIEPTGEFGLWLKAHCVKADKVGAVA